MTTNKKPNPLSNAANLVTSPLRSLTDPVKKVCYPRLEAHWEEKYKRRFPRHALKLLIFDFILLVLASALAVALVLVHTALPEILFPRAVSLTIREPAALESGTATELLIEFTNGSDHLVHEAELLFETEGQFVFDDERINEPDKDTDSATGRSFELGDLPSQATGTLAIPGWAFVPPGQNLPIMIKLSYWEPGRANKTVNSIYYELPVSDSPFDIKMNLPDPLMNDTVNAITVDYANAGTETLRNATVRFSPPPGFRITGARPRLSRNGEWRLGDLPAEANGRLTVYGILKPKATPSFTATALAEATDGLLRPMNELRLNADAVTTGFNLTHDVFGLTTLVPGQIVPAKIKFTNSGEQIVTNLTIRLQADSPYLPAPDETPIWNADSTAQLQSLAPGESGEVSVDLQLVEYLSQEELLSENNPTLTVSATAEYTLADQPQRTFRTDSEVTVLPISTKLLVDAAALYYTQSGDQLGLGPWPPQVGETTRLWVVVSIENGPNTVRDAVLTANLMPAAEWTGKTSVSAGRPLAYVASDRKLIWEIGDLPAFTGGHLPRATANFEIEITPTEDDLAQTLKLLDHIIIEGEDNFTGGTVRATGTTVTTKLRFGPAEALGGMVTE